VIADRGYDADRVIDLIERQGLEAVIPPRKHRCTKPRCFDAVLYRQRQRVEFFSFNKLKQFRRVATRYEKTARNCLAMVQIGCIRIWARAEAAGQRGLRLGLPAWPSAGNTGAAAPGP
jgi:transposase